MRNFSFVLLISLIAGLSSCNITRHVPAGQFLLMKNGVEVVKEKELSRSEQITSSALEPYIRQKPVSGFLGFNAPVWIYNQANPSGNTWWNRTKRRIGREPVILDTTLTRRSADNMKIFMDGKGFLDSRVHYRVDTASRKAKVTYEVTQGAPYRIGKINYDFRDEFLRPLIQGDSLSTLLKTGNVFDVNVLNDERKRITDFLKNRGYYKFNVNNIIYSRSPSVENTIDIRVIVKQDLSGYDENGNEIMDNNSIYRFRDIYIYPNYDPTVAFSDPLYQSRLDTIEYRGLNIVYDSKLNIRPEILRRTINLYPNYLYSEAGVKRTYDNIMRLGYYRSASILYSEQVSDSTSSDDNLITFIGGDDEDGGNVGVSYTRERYIDCNIMCTPALRQSYTVGLEGTTSSDYFGITANVGYQNRSLFRGVELFDLNVRGGYEFMRVKGKRNSFEVGGTASFSFPRFITPFKVDRYNRTFNPRTRTELSYNIQRRPYYHRTISNINWGYSWGNGRRSSFIFKPVDISVIKIRDMDSVNFLNTIKNPYLRESYKDKLLAGLSGSYIFSSQPKNVNKNVLALRVNFETSGNLINGITRIFDSDPGDSVTIFKIPYGQYLRVDANLSKKFVLGPKTGFISRFYGGWGYAYGNSNTIPFERLFYAGGPNSMRGWLPRTLGPGNAAKADDESGFPRQLANFKLEANLEFRFPVWNFLQGATFLDAGNIWYLGQGGYDDREVFRFKSFFPQLGLNTGVGARLDFSYFVLRIDWGIKLHDPNEIHGKRWINDFQFRNTALNFGVGYPF